MSAILGYADLMLDPNQSQSKNLNGLQAIRRNGEHLLELINNVLDLSKIEARHMTTERIPTQFPRLIAEAISMTRPRAIGKDLSLQLEFTTPVPREIRTDPLRLRQALVNLIGNAVKFTEAGTIVVKVSCTRSLDTHTEIRIDVVDTGVGISRDKQDKLFQPFSQSDLTTTRRFGGTGLGLTLSQSFIQLLGGDITFESEEGRGSIFSIHLPVGPINAEELVDGSKEAVKGEESLPKLNFPNASLAGCRVLLAEDGVDNREILAAFVRGAGAIVDVAVNGREAVAMALNSKLAGNQHDLILMDMQMPELDGYGATSELRRRGYTGPIVALTAHAMSTDRDKCLISGCNDYMSKPVQRQALLGLVSKFFTRKEQAISPPLAEAIAPAKTLRSPLADEPQFAGVLAGFVSRLPLTVAELRHCMESNTLPELSRAAHKLRGAGGSYELQELTDAASVVEDDLAAGATLAAIRPQCDALIATIRRIEGYDPNAESAKKAA
jgi:CheY-like chemotaxis protein/HPt (histidine-containing phosphotransfer) domain-containing protein